MIKLKQKMFSGNELIPVDTSLILDCDFNNNFINKVSGGVQLIAGNGNGLPDFVNGAVNFNGVTSLKTSSVFSLNSDKVTIQFDIKTSQTGGHNTVVELSPDNNTYNSFAIYTSDLRSNKIQLTNKNQMYNIVNSVDNINTGNWTTFRGEIDRSLGKDQNKIFLNNASNFNQEYGYYNNNTSLFGNFILFIGARNGNTARFIGQIRNLKIWNRILTPTEIANL